MRHVTQQKMKITAMRYCLLATFVFMAVPELFAQAGPRRLPADRLIVVDDGGILRWSDTGDEVALFGVNYLAPHYTNYADLKELGSSIEQVINTDLAHLVRMGMDAIRVHVFDREISDASGNLIENDHLRLLDYLIAQAKGCGLYMVLTPIAWWPTVNPSVGFSNDYSMMEMTTNARAWSIQAHYLRAFVEHVNPFTGIAYKDDPGIAVFELINEPQYSNSIDETTVKAYINTLSAAIRGTGCRKPLFYNAWGGFAGAVRDADVDGASFVWYPSGLVSGKSLWDDFLPRVDRHPTMHAPELEKKAKMVYEFDAADVPGGYLYPAMARAFRSGGAQIAMQFQYDPLPLAPFNRGWMTHYLNLVYTPGRAVAMLIAGEVFRNLPRYQSFGSYPENAEFGPARVFFQEDLADYLTETEFYYSNHTTRRHPCPEKLRQIVGCGSSSVVSYDGTGAYFLEKEEPGLWRLEVFPDAVWVADPYSFDPYGDRQVARIYHRAHRMKIDLPDLGKSFWITEKKNKRRAFRGSFRLTPGVYFLHRKPLPELDERLNSEVFRVPPEDDGAPTVWCSPPRYLPTNVPLNIEITAAGFTEHASFRVLLRNDSVSSTEAKFPMRKIGAYRYRCILPVSCLNKPSLSWVIESRDKGIVKRYPADEPKHPGNSPESPFVFTLFPENCGESTGTSSRDPSAVGSSDILVLDHAGFTEPGEVVAVRRSISPSTEISTLGHNRVVSIYARSDSLKTSSFQFALVQSDGNAYGIDVPVLPEWREICVPLNGFRPLWSTTAKKPVIGKIESFQCAMGTWNLDVRACERHVVEIRRIQLLGESNAWRTKILRSDDEIPLFDASWDMPYAQGHVLCRQWRVTGSSPEQKALCLRVDGFGPPPNSIGFRNEVGGDLNPLRDRLLSGAKELVVRARAVTSETDKIEVVLLEQDGSPWGTVVSIGTDWQDICIPLEKLSYFAHWEGASAREPAVNQTIDPRRLSAVHVCYGAWLYPGYENETHCFELERISVR